MGDIKRQRLVVALGYVRTLMQEIADDAEVRTPGASSNSTTTANGDNGRWNAS